MEKLNGIPISNKLLLELTKVGVLLFAEFPSTVVLKANLGNIYIQEWVDCTEDGLTDRYFLYETTSKILSRFLKNEISHSDLVFNSLEGFVFFYDKREDYISELTIISNKNIPFNYIPSSENIQLPDEIVDIVEIKSLANFENVDTKIDLSNKVREVVNKQKTDIYNLHIIKGNGVVFGRIKTDILGEALIEFDNLYSNVALDFKLGKSRGSVNYKKNIFKELTSTEVVQTCAASFSVLIKPAYTDYELFNALTSSEHIAKVMFSLLKDSIETSNFIKTHSNFSEFTISAYKAFLQKIFNHDISIDISYLSNKNQLSFNQEYDLKLANKIITDIENFRLSEEDNFNKIGKFRALNCDTGHFIFVSNNDEIFNGYMDKRIKEGSERITFTKLYQIDIDRKITKEASKEKPKIEDTIIAFYEQGD